MNKTNGMAALAASIFLSMATPGIAGDAEANALLVEAVQLVQAAEQHDDLIEKLASLNDAISKLDEIVAAHPSSGLAVSLATGQSIGNVNPALLKQERDKLDAEVQVLLSDQQAVADAKAAETQWINEVMECVEDIDCARDLYVRKAEESGQYPDDIAFSLAYFEVLQNGYSRAFDRQVDELLSAAGEHEAEARRGMEFMAAHGIFHDKPKTVLKKMSALVQIPDSIQPAIQAISAGLPELAEEYLELLANQGLIDDVESARNSAYESAYGYYTFDDLQKFKTDFENAAELDDYAKEDLLAYLSLSGDPDFLDMYESTKSEFGESAAMSMVTYQFVTGEPSEALRYFQELQPRTAAHFLVGGYVYLATPRNSRGMQAAMRDITKISLLAKRSDIQSDSGMSEAEIVENTIDENTAAILLMVSGVLR